MNVHQPVIPTPIVVLPNVYVLGIQPMNPSIGHTPIPINYQSNWQSPITPFVRGKINTIPTSTYPIWYNVILPYIPLDPNLYPAYTTKEKKIDLLIPRNYTSYVPRYVFSEQLVIPPI